MSAGARVGRGWRGEGGPERELRYAGAAGGERTTPATEKEKEGAHVGE